MPDASWLQRTRRDYDAVAEQYDELVRRDSTEPFARAMITAFAALAGSGPGRVLDVGCGPGQWTDALDRLGLHAHGVDLSPVMIGIARRYRPDLGFAVGSMLDLPVRDGWADGVLAHFSLLHTPPPLVPRALGEIARVLTPGGTLLLAGLLLDGPDPDEPQPRGWAPYDHRASPAYRWTLDALAGRLAEQGFAEVARLTIASPPQPRVPAGYLLARLGNAVTPGPAAPSSAARRAGAGPPNAR